MIGHVCQVSTPPYSHVSPVSDIQGSGHLRCGCCSLGATPDIPSHSVNSRIMRGSLLLSLLSTFVMTALADVTSMTDKILKDILKDYNPKARPAGNLSDR